MIAVGSKHFNYNTLVYRNLGANEAISMVVRFNKECKRTAAMEFGATSPGDLYAGYLVDDSDLEYSGCSAEERWDTNVFCVCTNQWMALKV